MLKRLLLVALAVLALAAFMPAAAQACVTPTGWVAYTVIAGDSAESLAAANGITTDELLVSNCLTDPALSEGQIVYVPGASTQPLQPAQPQPNVTVDTPAEGAVVPIGTAFTVNGTGASYDGNVTVQVLDANSNVIAQQLSAFNGIVPGSGAFIVNLTVNGVQTGSAGRINAFVVDANGTIVAIDSNDITFGQQPQPGNPTVIIVNPQSNSVLPNNGTFYVSGTSANLTNLNLIVRAINTNGNVLAEANVTAAGPGEVSTEGAGGWSTNLSVSNIPSGTPGAIKVIGTVGSGLQTLANQAVIYGPLQQAQFIDITNPPPNATLYTDRPIRVNGVAGGLFENALVVRALDANGNIIAQVPVTTNAPNVGGTGGFVADLFVNVAPGTAGSIYAFATSANDGSVVAEDRVPVTFGGPCIARTDWPTYTVQRGDTLFGIASRTGSTVAALTQANCLANANLLYAGQVLRVPNLPATPAPNVPAIAIISPLPQTILADAQVIVTGTAQGLQQGNVIVRALDLNGTVLAQQAAQVSAAQIGGVGQWQTTLVVSNVAPGTAGYIYAYSSALDGSIIADAIANVVFGNAEQAVEASLIIDAPQPDAAIVAPVTISGRGTGLFGAQVFVRLLDNLGTVIAEGLATASTPDAAGAIRWESTLDGSIPLGTQLTVFAYAVSPLDESIVASAAANVVVGQVSDRPFVTIIDPIPYSAIPADEPFVVTGRAGRLTTGEVIVRAVDDDEEVLDELVVPISGVNTAGEGSFEAAFDLSVRPGTRGALMVFGRDEAGEIIAMARTRVVFGDASTNNRFIQITSPLPDTLVDLNAGFSIAGQGGGLFEGNVVIAILSPEGEELGVQPVTLNATEVGGVGAWSAALSLPEIAIADGVTLVITAYSESPADGSVVASDQITVVQSSGASLGVVPAGAGPAPAEGTAEPEAQG